MVRVQQWRPAVSDNGGIGTMFWRVFMLVGFRMGLEMLVQGSIEGLGLDESGAGGFGELSQAVALSDRRKAGRSTVIKRGKIHLRA